MFKFTPRDIDVLISELIMGVPVVHKSWPCHYTPDCGDYEASSNEEIERDYDEPGPVYCPERGTWPPVKKAEYFRQTLYPGEPEYYCSVEPVPFYSIKLDIAASAILRMMTHKGFEYKLTGKQDTDGVIQHKVQFSKSSVDMRSGSSFVSDFNRLPLAICLAALAEVEDLNIAPEEVGPFDDRRIPRSEQDFINLFLQM